MPRFQHFLSGLLSIAIFILPFSQILLAFSYQQSLISAAPERQIYNKAAYRDIYTGVMRQGQRGFWAANIPYTTEYSPRVFGYNIFFVLLGQINRILKLEITDLLHLTQYLMGPILFIATFFAFKKILPNNLNILAYFFTLIIETGFYIPVMLTKEISKWVPSFDWQQQLIERHFGLPHHTFGKAIGIIFSAFFIISTEKINKKALIVLFITSLIGGLTLPPYFFVFLTCAGLPLAIIRIFQKQHKELIAASLVTFIPLIAVTVFLKFQFSLIPALANYTATEKSWWDNTDTLIRYASSLLLYYPFILLGLFALIAHWKKLNSKIKILGFICLTWLTGPVFLILISNNTWFPFANARLVDGYQYIPAGILSALGIWGIVELFSKKIRIYILSVLIIVIALFSYKWTSLMIENFYKAHSMPWTNIYPFKSTWDAISFLKTVPIDSGVLSLQFVGEIIPGYADVRIYVAASGTTWPYYEDRLRLAQRFFYGELLDQEAINFLINNKIDYIYYGPDEKRLTRTEKLYQNILDTVYVNDLVTIFIPKSL